MSGLFTIKQLVSLTKGNGAISEGHRLFETDMSLRDKARFVYIY